MKIPRNHNISFGTPVSHKHPLCGGGGKLTVETLKVWETRRPKRNSRSWCVPSGDAVDGDTGGWINCFIDFGDRF